MLEISGLSKDYEQAGTPVRALSLEHLEAARGEAIAVTGPSGSGKTTLLRILAALIPPTSGTVRIGGRSMNDLGMAKSSWRASNVGYICQDVNLLPDFDIMENMLIAAEISHVPNIVAQNRALNILQRLDLKDRARHRPAKLSLGEQQRAAIARAVIHNPPMLLADEPTASLDAENARNVIDLLLELCAESQALLIASTHDEAVKRRFPRVVELRKAESQL